MEGYCHECGCQLTETNAVRVETELARTVAPQNVGYWGRVWMCMNCASRQPLPPKRQEYMYGFKELVILGLIIVGVVVAVFLIRPVS